MLERKVAHISQTVLEVLILLLQLPEGWEHRDWPPRQAQVNNSHYRRNVGGERV